jgi:N-acetylglutamate synthase-like GNAT family acetyltransferase
MPRRAEQFRPSDEMVETRTVGIVSKQGECVGVMNISDLATAPHFFDIVADRIWREWHAPRGVTLADFRIRLDQNMLGHALPKAFVARHGQTFLGTVSLIASDLDERPALSPWIAALWVEPGARETGVGAKLLAHATSAALASGAQHIYLCAEMRVRAYYLKRGWRLIETDVGPRQLSILSRASRQEL